MLEKWVGIFLLKLDIYVVIVGGLSVEEFVADLGVVIVVVVSFCDCVVDFWIVLLGEVGLGG